MESPILFTDAHSASSIAIAVPFQRRQRRTPRLGRRRLSERVARRAMGARKQRGAR